MVIQFDEITPREIFKGYKGKFIHTATMTMAFWEVAAGAAIPLHHHVHEQICQVLKGQFQLTIGGDSKVYQPGCVVVIPSNVPHSGIAITDCSLMDVFSPVREDYKL